MKRNGQSISRGPKGVPMAEVRTFLEPPPAREPTPVKRYLLFGWDIGYPDWRNEGGFDDFLDQCDFMESLIVVANSNDLEVNQILDTTIMKEVWRMEREVDEHADGIPPRVFIYENGV